MAAKTAKVVDWHWTRGGDDAGAFDTVHTNLRRGYLTLTHNAQEVIGGTDTLDCDVAATLAATQRNGKTYALRHVALEQAAATAAADPPASGGLTAVTASVAISSNTVQLSPKSATNGTSNATIAAADKMIRPYRVFCVVSES